MEFSDDYEHTEPYLTYIFESIKTHEVENLITDELSGCDCTKDCVPNKCSCLQRSGALYLFSSTLDLKNYKLKIADMNKPMYECNYNCKCVSSICGNKLVQLGPRKGLKIVKVKEKGMGLITEGEVDAGNFICEYAGEVITDSEAHLRFETYSKMKLNHNYIFCINENFGDRNEKTFIDPTFYGNIGRYINHSCEPNSVLVPIRISDKVPKLCIFAKQVIEKNTEITFDYGELGSSTSGKICRCLSPQCRNFLPFDQTI